MHTSTQSAQSQIHVGSLRENKEQMYKINQDFDTELSKVRKVSQRKSIKAKIIRSLCTQVGTVRPTQHAIDIRTENGQNPNHVQPNKSSWFKKTWQDFQRQSCIYKSIVFLDLILFLGFCVIVGYYAEEVWKGYQAKEVSIKVSKKKMDYMEHPTVTLW